MQRLVEFVKEEGALVVRLTDHGRQNVDEIRAERQKQGTDRALFDVCEYQFCNGWETLNDQDKLKVGALTGCEFIITDEAERDDHGNLVKLGAVFWNPNYAVEDEIELLLTKGEFRLVKA